MLLMSLTKACSDGPFGFQDGELVLERRNVRIKRRHAVGVVDAKVAVADKRGAFRFAGRNGDAGVLDQRRRRALADRHTRRGGVEEADGLVRQLPRRNVAMRQIDGGDDGRIGNPHAVMLLHWSKQPAQHHAAGFDIGFVDLDGLKAPSERRIFLDILAVFGPGGRGDGAQRAAGERRLEEIGGVTRAGGAACADQGVGFVDEEDDRARRALNLVDHRAQPLFEFALHRGAGLHQADIERAEPDILEWRRNIARCDTLGKAFDHRGLADAGFAGQDRVVLPPAHQDVDQLADLVVAAEDRVHLAGSRLGGQILRKPVERRGAFRATDRLGSRRRRSQSRTIHRTQRFFLGGRPDLAVFAGQDVDGHLAELG